ncbi:Domain of uncharacterised function (DUF1837) [Neisseria zoodegmatis]|uniref:Domain of uncharacterized function (DUF1837) n=1 Tax=Neisseria zoodegmatis TaxID=326523 RepID=A0A378WU17_9NEIS|nr:MULTISPECIES: DUF1837 domain-containing protein [Neisseria]SUA44372.1 Domain of uncharacterised function (DUF1837) [Neisseria zoodegmatis]
MFRSDEVIKEEVFHDSVHAYFVGYSMDKKYRWDDLARVIIRALPEFAYGIHLGTSTDNSLIMDRLREAAKALYQIKSFSDIADKIQKEEIGLDDEIEDKYLRRGEFGELILHLLLRDRFKTIPLVSKIYFKDSLGHTVHGFDCVHIEPESRTLWLGESKLYIDPLRGISALIKDLDEHLNCEFLEKEFNLISKKVHGIDSKADEYNELIRDRDYWIRLLTSTDYKNTIKHLKIPLICTYTSDIFSRYDDEENEDFKVEYKEKIEFLKRYFQNNLKHEWKDKVEIILILFPVLDKNELVKILHTKIKNIQSL